MIFLFLFFAVPLTASNSWVIDESEKFDHFLEEITENSIVFLDIDDTLIQSQTTLGSPACFYNLKNFFEEKYPNIPLPNDFLEEIDKHMQWHVDYEVTDSMVYKIIEKCKEKNVPCFGLTNRPDYMANVTSSIIKKLNIHFSKEKLPFRDKLYTLNSERPIYICDGIIFCDDQNLKGEVAEHFLKNLLPSSNNITKIVFADDKERYLHMLEKTAMNSSLDYYGLYYVKNKGAQKTVDMNVAFKQLDALIKLFPENEEPIDNLISKIENPDFLKYFFKIRSQEGKLYMVGKVLPDATIKHQDLAY